MENNKIIIIALIVVIAALLIGIVAVMPNLNKEDTTLTFKGKTTLNEGDSLKILLTDANGNILANQNVNVTITDKDNSNSYYSVVTDENGVGTLKLDKNAGKYSVAINFGGNDKYKGCNASQQITIKEKEVEAETTSSSSSSSTPSAYAYRSDGSPMYSQAEVDHYMYNKYGSVNYHVGDNGYIDMDEPGYDDAGNRLW